MKYNLLVNNFKYSFTFIMVSVIGSAALGLIAIAVLLVNIQAERHNIILEKELNGYVRFYSENIKQLLKNKRAIAQNIEDKNVKFENLFIPIVPEKLLSTGTLSFKAQLFNIESKLRLKANDTEVFLPDDLGFSEYALKVPEKQNIDVLFTELFMMRGTLDLLLDVKLSAITKVKFPLRNKQINSLKSAETVDFKKIVMELSFCTNFDSLKEFLVYLVDAKGLYIIKELCVNKTKEDNGNILVDMVIEHIEIKK
ncbi:MAG: hypothetical protein DRP78_00420 [Candidatus Omnitrophota bacterium]|nr:MAG: hypothetical protein DRP78_00420 [Candidatus Omnitrophota bacterium]